MTEENPTRIYSTQGVDWTDDDAIREFARQVHRHFVASVLKSEAVVQQDTQILDSNPDLTQERPERNETK